MAIRVKRAYDSVDSDDGQRVLVDRVWPRGRKRESLALDTWLKDVAPSNELRRWFGHEADRWDEFRRRYSAELEAQPDVVQQLLEMTRHGDLTLVYGARDEEHNQAVALKEYLEKRLRAG